MAKRKIEINNDEIDDRILKLAQKIKAMRIAKGYSSYENFAWDHELNRVQYWRMEKGVNFTINSLLKILDIHQITLKDFFNEDFLT